jgi:hypothetical protein
MKSILKRLIRRPYRQIRSWLAEPEDVPVHVPFDNRYTWLGNTLEKLMLDPRNSKRAAYIWGVLQGVALGKVLGMDRVSVLEFGVAGGRGLLALEHIAASVEEMLKIGIDVYGFDTGTGLPEPRDYRDCPNIWLGEGQFPMDQKELEKRLQKASLKLGVIAETVPEFLNSSPAPVAFVSVDVDLYSSTSDALKLFEAEHSRLLPRVLCYFDDIFGLTYSDFNGERLAISEFNSLHAMRKLSPLYGLKYFVPSKYATCAWPESFYFLHIHDHPLYNEPDEVLKPMFMTLEGEVTGWLSGRTRLNIPSR